MNLATGTPLYRLIKQQLKKASVCVSVLSHRKVSIECVSDIITVFSSRKHDFHWMPLTGEADVSRGRSRIASAFLKTTDEILMFIDDDLRFKKEDVEKIIDHVVGGKLICGAHYVQKGTIDKTMVMEDGEPILFRPDQTEPKKCVAMAGGFVAFHRDAILKTLEYLEKQERYICQKLEVKNPDGSIHYDYSPIMREERMPLCNKGASWEFYPLFNSQPMKLDGGWRFIPEDWSLQLLAKEAGIDSWVDPSIMLSHVGEYEYDFRDKNRPPKVSWDEFKGVAYK